MTYLQLKQQSPRIFDEVSDSLEEASSFSAIEEPVVVSQCDVHDGPRDYLVSADDGSVDNVVHAQDGGLRRVDDWGRHHGAKDTAVRHGEGAAGHFLELELIVLGFLREQFECLVKRKYVFAVEECHLLHVAHDWDHQALRCLHSHTHIDVVSVYDFSPLIVDH